MVKTKIAVIGLGGVAQLIHLPLLNKMNSVEICAVAEKNKSRLILVSDKYNIKNKYTDYKKLLAEQDIDAVIIATPTDTHQEIAVDCIKAGKHILIEKPIALNSKEALKINNIAKQNNKIAMVGMNQRFRPDAMLLKSLINSGELGEIFYIKCSWIRKQSSEQSWFMKKDKSGGGVIFDLGIVLLDLAEWLLDYPTINTISVQKFSHKTTGVEDSAVGLFRFKENSLINMEVSWSLHSDKDSFNLTAFGTEGTAHLNPLRAYKRVESGRIDYTPAKTTNLKNLFKKSYENELKHFIGAIRNSSSVISSSEEALNIMKLLEGINKSAEQNKEISF